MDTQPIDVEIVSRRQHLLGEGPIWDADTMRYLWVDAFDNAFYALRVEGAADPTRHETGFFTIGVTSWSGESGRLLLAGNDAVYEWTETVVRRVAGAPFSLIPRLGGAEAGGATHRFNDVIAGPGGEYIAGIMPWKPTEYPNGGGALVCYTDRQHPFLLMSGVYLPNGMGFSPDGRWFYFTDSIGKTIYRFPYRRGAPIEVRFGPPEPFIVTTDRDGAPDGMTVAADGSIFSARWGGASVDRFDSDGRGIARYAVPMKQPSSVAFGGHRLDTLIVTSATENMESPGRDDGIIVTMRPGVRGLPENAVDTSF